ncbi:septal ring lytic transglycosylase RlpA family protein [Ferrovum sp.]|uniref:septal ring lytic transglycosylase RlpA family protein n=1 Tax=Ferrovum sp. TaxID=2609467 RepID=UPI002604F558|nr:septal ring lytic transglycosylase RlpA family protein [Ferrovum sp.]
MTPHQKSLLKDILRSSLILAILAGCSTTPPPPAPVSHAPSEGGRYQTDGPGLHPPANLADIPDAVPRKDPLNKFANRPYTALGKVYVPDLSNKPYKVRGMASWYGRKFHNQKTSTGELYDMYGMTAANTTLPLPCYVRVTNLANHKSVVVRVNDRGPFKSDRVIDLTYTAAWKLGFVNQGSAWVEVERIFPE